MRRIGLGFFFRYLKLLLSEKIVNFRLFIQKEHLMSDNESEGIESELIEALGREARLKDRLQELVSTFDKVYANLDLRHLQSDELVKDLKRANG